MRIMATYCSQLFTYIIKKTCKIASFYSCVTTSVTAGVGVGVALNQIIFVANSCKVVRGGGVV